MIIYKITSKTSGKSYIGKTKLTISGRFKQHISEAHNKCKLHFQKAINKYGEDDFELEILENVTEENWRMREKYWILYFNSFLGEGYNMTSGGEGVSGLFGPLNHSYGKTGEDSYIYGIKRSKETKVRMGESRKKYLKENPDAMTGENNPNYGNEYSKESKDKMSEKWKEREIIQCPYCKLRSQNNGNMNRWHMDNCKLNPDNPDNILGESLNLFRVTEKITCPHCGKIGDPRGFHRWHFDNCKQKPD